jgi:O-antigen/teichoic acid export membrane protein
MLRADTLADSVVILLTLTVVQRLIGFGRAILFCRWLPPEQLGQWDMAFSFLMLAAPLSMLALSSSFGRYLEHYRGRGHVRTLLRRTSLAVLCSGAAASAIIFLGRPWFSQLIFGTPDQTTLVALMAAALFAVVVAHYFLDLLTALRYVRMLALVQLLNSVAFAVLGVGLLFGWQQTAESVVIAYGGACCLSAVWVVWRLRPTWRALPVPDEMLRRRAFWGKILPYVAWISLGSLLANMFEIADRYMIIHFSRVNVDAAEALSLVGQYHSSRVVPLLMVSIALMLGGIIIPHLSHDWEQGRRDRVRMRLNLFLKMLSYALSAAAAVVLLAAPLLFERAFEGKFDEGLTVLPLTLTYCIWFGITIVSQNYLLCAEKARLGSLALLVGLVVNVILNLILLPLYGLIGAVLATTVANFVALVLLATFNRLLGFRLDRVTWVILLSPILLYYSAWAVLGVLATIAVVAAATHWVFSPEEKHQLAEVSSRYIEKLKSLRRNRP